MSNALHVLDMPMIDSAHKGERKLMQMQYRRSYRNLAKILILALTLVTATTASALAVHPHLELCYARATH
jgi:hypothetical protein